MERLLAENTELRKQLTLQQQEQKFAYVHKFLNITGYGWIST